MGKATLWTLQGSPKNIVIIDHAGNKREPDIEKIKKYKKLRGTYIAGRYGKGVGQFFYGGKLGNKKELTDQGNKYTTNDEILEAIGYEKKDVEIS